MAVVMNEKLEKHNQELAKRRRAQHEEKILEHQMKQPTRKERTQRFPLRWLRQLILCGFAARETPYAASCSYPTSLQNHPILTRLSEV